MKNFLNVFMKLPMGVKLIDICFYEDLSSNDADYGGIGTWRNSSAKDTTRKNSSLLSTVPDVSKNVSCEYPSTTPLHHMTPQEKEASINYLKVQMNESPEDRHKFDD